PAERPKAVALCRPFSCVVFRCDVCFEPAGGNGARSITELFKDLDFLEEAQRPLPRSHLWLTHPHLQNTANGPTAPPTAYLPITPSLCIPLIAWRVAFTIHLPYCGATPADNQASFPEQQNG